MTSAISVPSNLHDNVLHISLITVLNIWKEQINIQVDFLNLPQKKMIVIIIFRYPVVLFYTFSICSWVVSQAFSDGLLSPKAFSNGLLSPQIHFQIHQLIIVYQYKHRKKCIWPYAVVNKVPPLWNGSFENPQHTTYMEKMHSGIYTLWTTFNVT